MYSSSKKVSVLDAIAEERKELNSILKLAKGKKLSSVVLANELMFGLEKKWNNKDILDFVEDNKMIGKKADKIELKSINKKIKLTGIKRNTSLKKSVGKKRSLCKRKKRS